MDRPHSHNQSKQPTRKMNNLYPTLFPNYNHLSILPSKIHGGGDGLFADFALIKGEIVVMMNVPRKMPSRNALHAKIYSEELVPHRDYTVAAVWLPYSVPPGSF